MATSGLGPKVTYVTDPTLTVLEQQRVLGEVVRAADRFNVRIAFRLPEATDDGITELVEWYWNLEDHRNHPAGLHSPLFHRRPALIDRFPGLAVWAPARLLDTGESAYAFSVHSHCDAARAINAGAGEVIFGHVYKTDSHPGEEGRGIAALVDVRVALTGQPGLTLTAIGGIDEASIKQIGRTGVGSIACIRAISRSPDIPATLQAMHQNWNSGYADFLRKGTFHDQ